MKKRLLIFSSATAAALIFIGGFVYLTTDSTSLIDRIVKKPNKTEDVITASERIIESGEAQSLSVSWMLPSPMKKMNILGIPKGECGFEERNTEYYKVGVVDGGEYDGADVVLLLIRGEDTCSPAQSIIYRFIMKDGEYIRVPEKWEDDEYYIQPAQTPKFAWGKHLYFSDLQLPDTIVGPKGEQYKLDPYVEELFSGKYLKKAFTVPQVGNLYLPDPSFADDSFLGSIYSRGGLYAQKKDGTLAVYSLVVPFIGPDHIANVFWKNGMANTNEYTPQDAGGCGPRNYLSVQTELLLDDLVQAGITVGGEPIYELKNSTDYLSNLYVARFGVKAGEVPTEEQRVPNYVTFGVYAENHPVFFWYDPLGRLIQFQNNKFMPLAECGKPVIYLYPEQTTSVHVELAPQGGFSKTEPIYKDGWNVLATPEGVLTDREGRTYPYLFWEGSGGIYETPEKGFIVSRPDVESFLNEKLSLLGLNVSEKKDFLEFWLPRMKDSPYYFITFLGNREMERIAPLRIVPEPDTVIRVLMDFQPLEQPISALPYPIRTPERKGFAVVEWGGVLR